MTGSGGTAVTDGRTRSILVRDIAAMASGHREETWGRAFARDPANPVRGFLLLPPERDPGSVFAYNQSATYTLAAIVQRQTGQTVTQYLQRRLLARLGGDLSSDQYPPGQDIAFTGMYATTATIAAVIAMTAGTESGAMQAVLSAVWDELLPGFAEAPRLATPADSRLRDRLQQLAMVTT